MGPLRDLQHPESPADDCKRGGDAADPKCSGDEQRRRFQAIGIGLPALPRGKIILWIAADSEPSDRGSSENQGRNDPDQITELAQITTPVQSDFPMATPVTEKSCTSHSGTGLPPTHARQGGGHARRRV